MAAKTEGIALLSMYNDEEEEEEGEQEERREGGRGRGEEEKEDRDDGDLKAAAGVAVDSESAPRRTPTAMDSRTPPLAEEGLDSKTLASPAPLTPTPPRPPPQHRVPPPPASSLSPLSLYSLSDALDAQPQGSGKRSLTIVDYAHDETAMSPEAEEYEKVRVGRLMFGEELHASAGIIEERTPQRIFQTSTPSSQCTPSQPFEQLEESKSGTNMTIDMMRMEIETHLEMDVSVSVEMQQEVDPLKNFLPPPLTIKCSEELQEKVNKFLTYRKAGKSFNADLRNRKDYRNPDFLQHAVRYQDIDQIGTCFSKDVFDPHGYDKSDYYDGIEADMKRKIERREQEKKKSSKIEYVSGGTLPPMVAPASKISTLISGSRKDGKLKRKGSSERV